MRFATYLPSSIPKSEAKKVIIKIARQDAKIGVFVKAKLTPTASASILVAIPRTIKVFMHKGERKFLQDSSSFENASKHIFKPIAQSSKNATIRTKPSIKL